MPPRLSQKLTFDPKLTAYIAGLPDKMLHEAFPRVVNRIVPPIKASIIEKLPDGQASGTRALQSAKTQARFPHTIQLKKNVGRKTISDSTGLLLIVGVSSKAGHVNFDHGDKAKKGEGRLHKLWWIDGKREVYATPKFRKQTVDISLQVRLEFDGRINRMMTEEVRREMRKQP